MHFSKKLCNRDQKPSLSPLIYFAEFLPRTSWNLDQIRPLSLTLSLCKLSPIKKCCRLSFVYYQNALCTLLSVRPTSLDKQICGISGANPLAILVVCQCRALSTSLKFITKFAFFKLLTDIAQQLLQNFEVRGPQLVKLRHLPQLFYIIVYVIINYHSQKKRYDHWQMLLQ